jgi:hypothetical protein
MTKLQYMVHDDAITRLHAENLKLALDLAAGLQLSKLVFPADHEIKQNGYEAAVENVYQQIVALGKAE